MNKYITSILIIILLFTLTPVCKGKKPEKEKDIYVEGVYFGGENSKWPMSLEEEFQFNPSKIDSVSALENEEGGIIILNSPKSP